MNPIVGKEEKMNNATLAWAQPSTADMSNEVREMLSYARQNYACHTDWYLRHRDAGIKLLGVALIANFTIGSLYFDHKLNPYLAVTALAVLAVLSIALASLAVRSCRQAYSAALEHALLVSKTGWAMGLAQSINISEAISQSGACPAREDKSLYVPRYIKDAVDATDTETFVRNQISKRGTTYFATKWTEAQMLWGLSPA